MPMNYINRLDLYCQQSMDNIWSKPSWYFKGDSNYWRVTQSSSEASELAGVLRSLSTVVGHIGMNVGRITWAGDISLDADRESIVLQPDFIMGDYPVPPGKMDVLTGVCVHEALRQSEWSGFTWICISGWKIGKHPYPPPPVRGGGGYPFNELKTVRTLLAGNSLNSDNSPNSTFSFQALEIF